MFRHWLVEGFKVSVPQALKAVCEETDVHRIIMLIMTVMMVMMMVIAVIIIFLMLSLKQLRSLFACESATVMIISDAFEEA